METKRLINTGNQATVGGQLRTVTELRKNTAGGIVVIWSSDNKQVGGCTPSVWMEWVDGVDQKQRRPL